MLAGIYQQMLREFGDTLKYTSKDSDEEANPKGRGVFMTPSQERVVNFDTFKKSIAAKFALKDSPKSCDALYMPAENEWFLIEFKNGSIDREKVFQIRRKIFESLLLLTEKLDKTICFTRENLSFILVYNETIPRIEIGKSLSNLAGNSQFFPFGLDSFKKLYFKEVYVWNKKEFDSNFVEKYCKSASL
jgi:MoaA/NifB/PqqE/SkfB family radical SAM enzyme